MNRIDVEIMKTLLTPEKSIYKLQESLKETLKEENTNYATVWRHIKKMKNDGFIDTIKGSKKNGSEDKRNTEIVTLRPKGIATLLIEGNLQDKDLRLACLKILQKDFGTIPPEFLRMIKIEDVFSEAILRIRPKVNLKFFDENYFVQIFVISFLQTMNEMLPKIIVKDKKNALIALNALTKIFEKKNWNQDVLKASLEYGKMLNSKRRKKEE